MLVMLLQGLNLLVFLALIELAIISPSTECQEFALVSLGTL